MPLVMYSGEQRVLRLNVQKLDQSGPLNLVGYALLCVIQPYNYVGSGAPPIITKSTGVSPGGITIDDQSVTTVFETGLGWASIAMNSADTVGLSGPCHIGLRLFPGALVQIEEVLTILRATVTSTTSP